MYANTYFKTQNKDFENFFTSIDTSSEVLDIKKEINALNKQLVELTQKYTEAQSKSFSKEITPINNTYVIVYESKNGIIYKFDLYTGYPAEEGTENNYYINCDIKSGTITVPIGYCYSLGGVIVRKYKYTIVSDNTKANTKIIGEALIPMFEDKIYTNKLTDYKESKFYHSEGLSKVNATEFLNTFFGIDKKVSFSLSEAKNFINNNASFEIILKTCENPEAINRLFRIKTDKTVPIHTLIGCKKEEYEILSKEKLIVDFIDAKEILEYSNVKEKIQKTNIELIELLKQINEWEEELNFWTISYNGNLLKTLVSSYCGGEYPYYYEKMNTYYPFGKYCNYVITEAVNQGFTSIQNFVSKLTDYIRMCDEMGIKPVLYSSYITQTHDITSRNYKIKITKEQEEIFAKRYADFKTFRGKNYIVIAPKDSTDVKQEGNELNHCVASYIKRILDDETRIYFLRNKEDIETRLLTVEVRDNKIVQARGNHNRKPTDGERFALREFAKKNNLLMSI